MWADEVSSARVRDPPRAAEVSTFPNSEKARSRGVGSGQQGQAWVRLQTSQLGAAKWNYLTCIAACQSKRAADAPFR
jgi:hypothetical protein